MRDLYVREIKKKEGINGREEELEVLRKRFEQSQKEWSELHAKVGVEKSGHGQFQENEKVATTVVSLLRESVPAGMGVN